jgi:hypothetical protein
MVSTSVWVGTLFGQLESPILVPVSINVTGTRFGFQNWFWNQYQIRTSART